LKRFTLT